MRILIACAEYSPSKSGYARVASNLAKELDEAGHSVELLTQGSGCTRVGRVAILTKSGRHMIDSRPDVVQVIGPTPLFTEQVVFTASRVGLPVVYTVYAFAGLGTYRSGRLSAILDAVYQDTVYRLCLGRVRSAVSSTQDFVQTFRFYRGPWEIIPTGVTDPCLNSTMVSVSDGVRIGPLNPRILFVGQLRPYKGVETLLRATRQVLDSGKQIEVSIVGEGPDRSHLEELASELDLRSSVSFMGALPDELLHTAYLTHDVLVLPSTEGESFGIVLLEGSVHGLHIVASDLPGVREVVRTLGGELVPPKDAISLAETLSRSKTIEPSARRFRADVARQYSWQSIASSYIKVYENILAG